MAGYPNKVITEGLRQSFMADPQGSTIGIWLRCKKVNPSAPNADGTPILQLCAANERADVITLQPIAAGVYGACVMANGGGDAIGVMSGNCNPGDTLYGAANGKVSTSSGGGAVLVGKANCLGADGGTVSYTPAFVAA